MSYDRVYIVSVCHGEYDDYSECPVAVCETRESAELIAEALENRVQPYFNEIMTNGFEHWIDFDFSVNVNQPIPFVKL